MGKAPSRDLGRLVAGRRQTERTEDPLTDDVLVVRTRGGGDDPAEDAVAKVRVLEPGPGNPREREAAVQQRRERMGREPLLAVAPWIVGRQAGRHRQQVFDGDVR
jgi:hypothetical protein